MTADQLAAAVRDSRGFHHKRDLSDVMSALQAGLPGAPGAVPDGPTDGVDAHRIGHPPPAVANGDDCAAIPDGDGHLLFAIEGFVEDFVAQQPWFAGYCGVMVNVSDIYAMGGRPLAVVDAHGLGELTQFEPRLGLAARYSPACAPPRSATGCPSSAATATTAPPAASSPSPSSAARSACSRASPRAPAIA